MCEVGRKHEQRAEFFAGNGGSPGYVGAATVLKYLFCFWPLPVFQNHIFQALPCQQSIGKVGAPVPPRVALDVLQARGFCANVSQSCVHDAG